MTSLSAGIATGLFAALHFQQMAPLGVMGNVLVMPILAFKVLPLAFIGVAAMPMGFEWPFLQVMGWDIGMITTIADHVASMSGEWTTTAMLHPVVLVTGLVALGWLAFFETRIRFAAALLAVPVIAGFGPVSRPDMMIVDSTQSLAVRFAAGYELIDGRDGSFAVRAWEQATGRRSQSRHAPMRVMPMRALSPRPPIMRCRAWNRARPLPRIAGWPIWSWRGLRPLIRRRTARASPAVPAHPHRN